MTSYPRAERRARKDAEKTKCKIRIWAYAFDQPPVWFWELQGPRGRTNLAGVGNVRGSSASREISERTARTTAEALGLEVLE